MYDIGRIVRIGTVSDVDKSKHLARVIYKDAGMTSSWLRVVDSRSFVSEEDDVSPFKQWMPKVNDAVLVICNPVNDSDGFVIGAVNT